MSYTLYSDSVPGDLEVTKYQKYNRSLSGSYIKHFLTTTTKTKLKEKGTKQIKKQTKWNEERKTGLPLFCCMYSLSLVQKNNTVTKTKAKQNKTKTNNNNNKT